MKWTWVWLAVCCASLVCAAAEQTYETYYSPALKPEEIQEIIAPIIGTAGRSVIVRSRNQLIVLATADQHRQIAALLKDVGVTAAPKNVRIEVTLLDAGQGDDRALAVTGTVSWTGGRPRRSGGGARTEYQTTTESSDVRQVLMVGSGRQASLFIGEEVPFLDPVLEYARQWGYVKGGVEIKQVGAKLVVEPTVIGDGPLINLRLTPELSGLVDGKSRDIRLIKATSELTVQDGQTIEWAGLGENKDFYNKFLVGMDRSGRQRSLRISLTPHIVESGSR